MDTIRRNTTEVNMDVNVKRIAWGAIFAGALIMLVTMLLLSLLGLGIGLGSINPASEQQPMQGLGLGAIIWWVLSNLIAVFVGGYVAGKLANVDFKGSGLLHGVIAWSLYTVISFYILTTTVGAIFSGVGSALTKSVSTIGSGVGQMVEKGKEKGLNLETLLNQVQGNNQSDTLLKSEDIANVVKDVIFKDGKLDRNIQRQDIENAIAQNTKYSKEQVSKASDEVYKKYQQAMSKVEEVKQDVEVVNEKASKAAIWSFVALLIGAILAALGGKTGGVRDDADWHTQQK